jgi:hypothetical protein
MRIIQKNIPKDSIIRTSLDRIDHADAFHCLFQTSDHITIEQVIHAFFAAAPSWMHTLFNIRDAIVKQFGLKTINRKERERMRREFVIQPGASLGLFNVFSNNEREVIMGEDDKHLNFRVSFLLEKRDDQTYELYFMTIVKFHNWLGKIYFLPVKPMHALVVKTMMRNTVKALMKNKT